MNWEALAVIGGFAVLLGIALYIPAHWWARRQLSRSHDQNARTTKSTWTCEKCGGDKRLMFIRAPWLIVSSVALLLLLLFGVRHVITAPAMQLLVTYLGGALALAPALSTVRIRCVDCEPQSNKQAW